MAQRSFVKRIGYDWLRFLCRLAAVALYGVRCRGRKHVPQHGPVLVCANHQSVMDPVIIGLTLQRRLNYLARKSLFTFAPFRWLIEFLDAIPLDRAGLGIGGIKECLRKFSNGEMVLIFPEGTRTRDGLVGPFQPGFITLARRGRVAVQPVAIDGAYQAWPRDAMFPSLSRISVCYGPAFTAHDIQQLDDDQFLKALETRVRECHALARQDRLRSSGEEIAPFA